MARNEKMEALGDRLVTRLAGVAETHHAEAKQERDSNHMQAMASAKKYHDEATEDRNAKQEALLSATKKMIEENAEELGNQVVRSSTKATSTLAGMAATHRAEAKQERDSNHMQAMASTKKYHDEAAEDRNAKQEVLLRSTKKIIDKTEGLATKADLESLTRSLTIRFLEGIDSLKTDNCQTKPFVGDDAPTVISTESNSSRSSGVPSTIRKPNAAHEKENLPNCSTRSARVARAQKCAVEKFLQEKRRAREEAEIEKNRTYHR